MKYCNSVFFILLSAFILWRIEDINLPFFWDETGVYVKAIAYMYKHSISLMPQSMPSELSRGHPLLFVFIHSLLVRTFGFHIWLLHTIALFISAATLITVFLLGKKVLSPIVGLTAAVLLAVQPLFVAQSMMVLPEMLLTFLSILTIYFFINKKRSLYLIACSLALLTKESAIILPFTLFSAHIFYNYWGCTDTKPNFLKETISKSWILSPLIIFFTFLIIQKLQMGWFFFPEHAGMITLYPKAILSKSFHALVFLLLNQNRFLFIIPCLFILYKLLSNILIKRITTKQDYLILILLSFFIGAVLFASINVMMNRYLLYLLPPISIMAACGLEVLFRNERFVVGAVFLLATISLSFSKDNKFVYDESLDYKDEVLVQKQATGYLETHNLYHSAIFTNYPIYHGLEDTCLGYLSANMTFDNVISPDNSSYGKLKTDSIQWVVIYDPQNFNLKEIPYKLGLIITYKSSYAQINIYRTIK